MFSPLRFLDAHRDGRYYYEVGEAYEGVWAIWCMPSDAPVEAWLLPKWLELV